LGGALAGFLFIKYLYTNNAFTNAIHSVSSVFSGLINKPKPKLTVHYKAESQPKVTIFNNGKPNQADVDAILDKINRSGFESLSKTERDILAKASKD
jgi:hypothetical protein